MSVEMRIKVVTLIKKRKLACGIVRRVILEIHFTLRKRMLSSSFSSVIHTISTSFPLLRVMI